MTMRFPATVVHGILRNKRGVYLLRAGLQQRPKRRADRPFMGDSVLFVLLQRGIVSANCFVIGFEVEFRHADRITDLGKYINLHFFLKKT